MAGCFFLRGMGLYEGWWEVWCWSIGGLHLQVEAGSSCEFMCFAVHVSAPRSVVLSHRGLGEEVTSRLGQRGRTRISTGMKPSYKPLGQAYCTCNGADTSILATQYEYVYTRKARLRVFSITRRETKKPVTRGTEQPPPTAHKSPKPADGHTKKARCALARSPSSCGPPV